MSAKVLIVDDNEDVRITTRRIVELLGYQLAGEAADGVTAVLLAKKLEPDLVIMDVEMPRMNGIGAAAKIQQVHPTPVILLTAHESPDLIQQARDAGVVAYLVKPLRAEEFARVVPIALARFQDWRELRRLNEELNKRNLQLQRALDAIKTLRGLLHICAWCGRKIQDEQGDWVVLESYIKDHSHAEFTHGICPECYAKMCEELEQQG